LCCRHGSSADPGAAPCPTAEVRAWVSSLCGQALLEREQLVRTVESVRCKPLPTRRHSQHSGSLRSRVRAPCGGWVTLLALCAAVIAATLKLRSPTRNESTERVVSSTEQLEPPATEAGAIASGSVTPFPSPAVSRPQLPDPPRPDGGAVRGAPSLSATASGSSKVHPGGAHCDPPYAVDSEGFLKVKSECL